MGNPGSKFKNETLIDDKMTYLDGSSPVHVDPRSPTPDISRTPLNTNSAQAKNITKNIDLNKAFDNYNPDVVQKSFNSYNPILMSVMRNHLQEYDPRSPAFDFERTPIVLPKSNPLGTLTDGLMHDDSLGYMSINNSAVEVEELKSEPPVRNLINGLAEISMDDSYKISGTCDNDDWHQDPKYSSDVCQKDSKYLETNFDFVESNFVDGNGNDNGKTEDASAEILILKNKFLDINDPRSPSDGINRTPLSLPQKSQLTKLAHSTDNSLVDEKCKYQNPKLKPSEIKSVIGDTLLIFEDNDIEQPITPQKSKTNKDGSRTPLSCVKNKTELLHLRSKSANVLIPDKLKEDTKNSRPNQKKVSKIPRLRQSIDGEILSKMNLIPNRNKLVMKQRSSWDHDSSIVL